MTGGHFHTHGGDSESVWIIGDLFTFLITGEQSGGRLFALEALVQPNNGPGPHVHHNADEHFYVAAGELTFWVGADRYRATAGDVVFIPRGTAHAFRNGPSPARLFATFTPAGMEAFFRHVGTPAADRSTPPVMTPEAIEALVTPSVGWEQYNETLPPSALPGWLAG